MLVFLACCFRVQRTRAELFALRKWVHRENGRTQRKDQMIDADHQPRPRSCLFVVASIDSLGGASLVRDPFLTCCSAGLEQYRKAGSNNYGPRVWPIQLHGWAVLFFEEAVTWALARPVETNRFSTCRSWTLWGAQDPAIQARSRAAGRACQGSTAERTN
jgi:hypothetical protein